MTSGEQPSSIVMPIFRIYNFGDGNFSSQLDSRWLPSSGVVYSLTMMGVLVRSCFLHKLRKAVVFPQNKPSLYHELHAMGLTSCLRVRNTEPILAFPPSVASSSGVAHATSHRLPSAPCRLAGTHLLSVHYWRALVRYD